MKRLPGADIEFATALGEHLDVSARRSSTCTDLLRASWPPRSAMGRLQGFAKQIREEHPRLSFVQAFNRAVMEHPSLYEQYLDESGLG